MTSPVELASSNEIGTVEFVAPDEIRVVLDVDAPQAVALTAGRPQRFPCINGFVLVPNEVGALVGVVTKLAVERSPFPKRTGPRDFGLIDLPYPLRKLTVVPLGTLKRSYDDGKGYELHRGVASFPSVGDPVHLPTATQVRALVDREERVVIGTSPLASDAPVSVDPDKIFGRHLAVLGNTGSGKSCTVAGLIRWSLDAADDARVGDVDGVNARFIVLDPNGEYRRTFHDIDGVRVFEVDDRGRPPGEEEVSAERLRLPAWMWNGREWAAFAQAAPGTQRPMLMAALRNLRAGATLQTGAPIGLGRILRGHRAQLAAAIAGGPAAYTEWPGHDNCGAGLAVLVKDAGTYVARVPERAAEIQALVDAADQIASDARWVSKDGAKSGYNAFAATDLQQVVDLADELIAKLPGPPSIRGLSEDLPQPFAPQDLADHVESLAALPAFSSAAAYTGTLTLRVRELLADPRLAGIAAPQEPVVLADWLVKHLGEPTEAVPSVTVIDLSMVPADVLHLVVAALARVIFEAGQRYRRIDGDALPTVLVLEEAHTFIKRHLPDEATSLSAATCREVFERIAREGRKFGLGLVLSSQRPFELSPTVLAQCNTFILHRLVNDRDQELVGRLVPDNIGGLLRELPSLPSQEAILLGWASPLPVLTRIRDLAEEHRPHSADPEFWKAWTGEHKPATTWASVAADWAGESQGQPDNETSAGTPAAEPSDDDPPF